MTREQLVENLLPHFQDAIAAIKAKVPEAQHDEAIEAFKKTIFYDDRIDSDMVDIALEVIERCV